jgi:hypothetical protein
VLASGHTTNGEIHTHWHDLGVGIIERSVFKLIIHMDFIGFALTRSSLVCIEEWWPVISELSLADPEEDVHLYRFSSESVFQCMRGTGNRGSALSNVASGQD